MEIYLIRKFSPIFNIKHDRAKLAERVLNVDFFEQAQQYSVSDAPILQTPSSELLAAVSARIENRALENMSFVEVESIAFALGLHVPCRTNKSSLVLQVKFCLQEYYTSDDIKDLPHQNERLGSAIRYTAKRSRKVISQEILSKVYCDLYALNIRELKRMASGLCVFRYSEMTKAELIQSIEQVRKKYTQDSSNDP